MKSRGLLGRVAKRKKEGNKSTSLKPMSASAEKNDAASTRRKKRRGVSVHPTTIIASREKGKKPKNDL